MLLYFITFSFRQTRNLRKPRSNAAFLLVTIFPKALSRNGSDWVLYVLSVAIKPHVGLPACQELRAALIASSEGDTIVVPFHR